MVQYISKKKINKLFEKLLNEIEPDTEEYKGLKTLKDTIMKL